MKKTKTYKTSPAQPFGQVISHKIKPGTVPVEKPLVEKKGETFYFQKQNFRWMLYGLGLILLGFLLMMGDDANTVDGVYSPNAWNGDIFSFRRIRLAPWLILAGFGLEVYAILKRFKE